MIRILFVLFFAGLFSCNNEKKEHLSKAENGGDEVIAVDSDDAAMNVAREKAASNYNEFLQAFAQPHTSLARFSVKMKFAYEEGNEHMWLADLFYKDGALYGVLDSDPMHINNVAWGDTLMIEKERVTDWMYIKDNTMIGGYTIKVLYDKLAATGTGGVGGRDGG